MSTTIPVESPLPDPERSLDVYSLGVVDYDSAWGLQERLIYDISGRADRYGVLLLSEHPPLVTMGREASRAQLGFSEDELARREIPLKWVSRGGGAIVHGPGQLAVYALLPVERLGISVGDYRVRLETAVSLACRDLQVSAKRHAEHPGLFSRGGQVGFFGAAVRSWVTCHGLYLNVAPCPGVADLHAYQPCGVRPTSLQALRLGPVPMSAVREAVARRVAEQFDYDDLHYSTGHPLLMRTRQRTQGVPRLHA